MILIQIDIYAPVQIYKRILYDRLQFFSLSLLSFCSINFTFYTSFHTPYYLPIYTAKALFNIFLSCIRIDNESIQNYFIWTEM